MASTVIGSASYRPLLGHVCAHQRERPCALFRPFLFALVLTRVLSRGGAWARGETCSGTFAAAPRALAQKATRALREEVRALGLMAATVLGWAGARRGLAGV